MKRIGKKKEGEIARKLQKPLRAASRLAIQLNRVLLRKAKQR
ncbi:MAG: hypothetical protein AAB601_00350 [Patescibacteria group bacterium]